MRTTEYNTKLLQIKDGKIKMKILSEKHGNQGFCYRGDLVLV